MPTNRIEKYFQAEQQQHQDHVSDGAIAFVPLNCMVMPIVIPIAVAIFIEKESKDEQDT